MDVENVLYKWSICGNIHTLEIIKNKKNIEIKRLQGSDY